MEIHFNGELAQVASQNVEDLLAELGFSRKKIAVELNRNIVTRSEYKITPIKEGDSLEIVHFVGGG